MRVQVNDKGSKRSGTAKSDTIVEVIEIFSLGRLHRVGMRLFVCIRIGSGDQLFFAIAMKAAGLLVSFDATETEIDHLSKLGKEKDKEGEYGEQLFHACRLKILFFAAAQIQFCRHAAFVEFYPGNYDQQNYHCLSGCVHRLITLYLAIVCCNAYQQEWHHGGAVYEFIPDQS